MKKILIAEDDHFLANAYRVKLEKEQFEVQVASDGDECLKMIKKDKPDVLVLDLIMPMKDGFSVLEELRKDDTYKKLPIVVASNLGQAEDIERSKSLGANDYIIKSHMSLDDIVKIIRKYASV